MPSVIAYASLSEKLKNSKNTYKKIIQHCKNLDEPCDIYSEEADPDSSTRNLWDHVIQRIKTGEVKILIVPNFFHIAGDKQKLQTVLSLCEANNTKLQIVDAQGGGL